MNESQEVQRVAAAAATLLMVVGAVIDEKLQRAVREKVAAMVAEALKELEPVLTRQEVAEKLKVSIRTIEEWQRRGVLPYTKIGKIVRYRMSEINAYWSENFTVRRYTPRRHNQ